MLIERVIKCFESVDNYIYDLSTKIKDLEIEIKDLKRNRSFLNSNFVKINNIIDGDIIEINFYRNFILISFDPYEDFNIDKFVSKLSNNDLDINMVYIGNYTLKIILC